MKQCTLSHKSGWLFCQSEVDVLENKVATWTLISSLDLCRVGMKEC